MYALDSSLLTPILSVCPFLCRTVPWIFKGFWNVIQPFVDPVTKNKCKFDEAIKGEVPANQLARDL